MRYWAPFGTPNVNDTAVPYVSGDDVAGIDGSYVPAQAVEHPMREILTAITASGQTPDAADLAQLMRAIRRDRIATLTEVASGTAGTQYCIYRSNLSGGVPGFECVLEPAPTAAELTACDGMRLRLLPITSHAGGSVLLGLNGGAPAEIRRTSNLWPVPGDIVAGRPVDVVRLGGHWYITSATQAMMRPRRVVVPSDVVEPGFAVRDWDEGAVFVWNIGAPGSPHRAILHLPNPTTLPDGWEITVEIAGLPTGFQAAALEVMDATPSSGPSLAARAINYQNIAHGPRFPVYGQGQVITLQSRGTDFVVRSMLPFSPSLATLTSGNAAWVSLVGTNWQRGPGTSMDVRHGDFAQYGAPGGGKLLYAPVPGLYAGAFSTRMISAAGDRYGTIAVLLMDPAGGAPTSGQILAPETRRLRVESGTPIHEILTSTWTVRLQAGQVLCPAFLGDDQVQIWPALTSFTLSLIGP